MNPLSTTEKQLQTDVAASRNDMIRFCRALLQTPSVNGVHDEIAVAEVIATEARVLGVTAEITGIEPRRPNVVITSGDPDEYGMVLVGHTDTVPPGDETLWTYPPYSGTIADGCIYGRGAVDTKGGIAASLYALAALHKHNIPARLVCVPDEESGATGTLGIKHLHRERLLRGTGAIYAYSGQTIHIGHRGLLRYRLRCHGQSVHTGSPEWQEGTAGASAVMAMADLLLRMENTRFAYDSQPYFDRFKTTITPGTIIRGGTAVNIVPDACEALVDVRTTPDNDAAAVDAVVQEHIAAVAAQRGVTFDVEQMNRLPAVMSAPDAPIFEALADVTQALTGERPGLAVAGPANEGYLLVELGIPTVCGFGPQGAGFHGIDEYVEVDSLAETAAIFAITAVRLAAANGG
ncbi:MAG: M20/M25/M40 family metallo-hydrolase [Chloroflexota bacterium]